jgi:hypothetical protein
MTRLLCVRLGAGPSSATLVNLHIVRRVALSQANIWSRCAKFERGDAGGAKRFGRHEPYAALAAIAGFLDALVLDVLKKCLLYLSVDLPEAEVVLVDGGHFIVPLLAQKPPASQTANSETTSRVL